MRISRDVDGKAVVIVFDSLDRLSPDQAFDLFHSNGNNLRALHCHFVFVVPISLFYQPQAPRLPFDDTVIMPMIPLLNRNGQPNSANINQLRTVLGRRFVADQIMPDPQKSTDDIIQGLIFGTVILVYDDNGVTWKDVHPVLALSDRFQELL